MEVEEKYNKRKRSKSNKGDESEVNSKGNTKATKLSSERKTTPIRWFEHASPRSVSQRGRELLQHLLRFDSMDEFESEYWLKKPYLRQLTDDERTAVLNTPNHPIRMLTMDDIKYLLKRKTPSPARFLKDVDVTLYENGKVKSLVDGDPLVNSNEVWRAYSKGYSIRLVHPQQWHDPLFELCSYLQEYFGFPTGCSSYLTPADAQGFPPHFDDVEIFVIQLEGKKRWRLYTRPDLETNPAANKTKEFALGDLGEPTHDFILSAGDILYFPRGTVHQAVSCSGSHSLHLTFSTYQRNTWLDLLKHVEFSFSPNESKSLQSLTLRSDSWLHNGLPLNILTDSLIQTKNQNTNDNPKSESISAWQLYGNRIVKEYKCPKVLTAIFQQRGVLEMAIDEVAKEFFTHCLPPPHLRESSQFHFDGLTDEEIDELRIKSQSTLCMRMCGLNSLERQQTKKKRKNSAAIVLYFNTFNGRAFASTPSPQFEVLAPLVPSVQEIISAVDAGVRLGDLEALLSEDNRGDMLDLLELMLEYKLVYLSDS